VFEGKQQQGHDQAFSIAGEEIGYVNEK